MRIARLALTNFRNYRNLDLSLPEGLSVLYGDNGQGKSNLLEALYLLSVVRSHRAGTESELVHRDVIQEGDYALVYGEINRYEGVLKVRVGLQCVASGESGVGRRVTKRIRVNGIPKRASDLVGQLNAVMFSANDIDLIYGPPAVRRRYLNVLLAQMDSVYLRSLQKYGRVLTQRNHLLRLMKEGRSSYEDLAYWDQSLAREGGLVLERRVAVMDELTPWVDELYQSLTGSKGGLRAIYRGTVQDNNGTPAEAIEAALKVNREREIALGMTVVGPHRDDLGLEVAGVDMSVYASRGQARTAALALRLGEARCLERRRGEQPVLLLDDVLSELDPRMRRLVLEVACSYEQVILTTADLSQVDDDNLALASRFQVVEGSVRDA